MLSYFCWEKSLHPLFPLCMTNMALFYGFQNLFHVWLNRRKLVVQNVFLHSTPNITQLLEDITVCS
jgi:hypothetical protein